MIKEIFENHIIQILSKLNMDYDSELYRFYFDLDGNGESNFVDMKDIDSFDGFVGSYDSKNGFFVSAARGHDYSNHANRFDFDKRYLEWLFNENDEEYFVSMDESELVHRMRDLMFPDPACFIGIIFDKVGTSFSEVSLMKLTVMDLVFLRDCFSDIVELECFAETIYEFFNKSLLLNVFGPCVLNKIQQRKGV